MNDFVSAAPVRILPTDSAVIEPAMIEIVHAAIRVVAPDVLRQRFRKKTKPPFTFREFLFRLFSLRYVHHGTEHLDDCTGLIQSRMADGVNPAHSSIRPDDSEMQLVLTLLSDNGRVFILQPGA